MKTSLRSFSPPPAAPPAREVLEAHAARLWKGIPFLWKAELDLWIKHSIKVGQELTIDGLELWMTRVQSGQCPIAGAGCAPPIPVSRFCKFHFDKREQP